MYGSPYSSGLPFALLGSTEQRWFLHTGLQLNESWFYWLSAVAQNGTRAWANDTNRGTAVSEFPDAVSLGDVEGGSVQLCTPASAQAGQPTQLAQTFTATQSGNLQELEIKIEGGTQVLGTDPPDPPVHIHFDFVGNNGVVLNGETVQWDQELPLPLWPQIMANNHAIILDPLAIAVSSGQVVTLVLTHPDGDLNPCLTLRDGANTYTGGQEMRDGVPQPDRDLAFRVTIR